MIGKGGEYQRISICGDFKRGAATNEAYFSVISVKVFRANPDEMLPS